MLLLDGCAGASLTAIPPTAPSTLNPQGPAAGMNGFPLLVVAGALVLVAYMSLVLLASWKRDRASSGTTPGAAHSGRLIPIAGIAVPAVLLLAAFGYAANSANALPQKVPGVLVIEVAAHQWWWQVHYPDAQVTTANEIHIPVGQPVEIRATSTDVPHSLWIPQLSGKLDLVPNRQTSTVIQASEAGIFRGECAEFCGIQHAHMNLIVIADSPDQFTQWLGEQQVVPPAPTAPNLRKGQQAFLGSACVYCHTIQGTNASGTLGPDLTHLASRQTIGAGMLTNSRGNLAGWIVDAQGIKPGNRMPPIQLEGDQLQAILDYMESLK